MYRTRGEKKPDGLPDFAARSIDEFLRTANEVPYQGKVLLPNVVFKSLDSWYYLSAYDRTGEAAWPLLRDEMRHRLDVHEFGYAPTVEPKSMVVVCLPLEETAKQLVVGDRLAHIHLQNMNVGGWNFGFMITMISTSQIPRFNAKPKKYWFGLGALNPSLEY